MTQAFQWQGRTDGETQEHLRIHQVINQHAPAKFALIGFASDEGVRRNKGRQGPKRIQMLFAANLQGCQFINHLPSKITGQLAVMTVISKPHNAVYLMN
ncbi:hypothetical protein AB6G58_20165 [Providencia huaxiensis]